MKSIIFALALTISGIANASVMQSCLETISSVKAARGLGDSQVLKTVVGVNAVEKSMLKNLLPEKFDLAMKTKTGKIIIVEVNPTKFAANGAAKSLIRGRSIRISSLTAVEGQGKHLDSPYEAWDAIAGEYSNYRVPGMYGPVTEERVVLATVDGRPMTYFSEDIIFPESTIEMLDVFFMHDILNSLSRI